MSAHLQVRCAPVGPIDQVATSADLLGDCNQIRDLIAIQLQATLGRSKARVECLEEPILVGGGGFGQRLLEVEM